MNSIFSKEYMCLFVYIYIYIRVYFTVLWCVHAYRIGPLYLFYIRVCIYNLMHFPTFLDF